MAQTQLHPYILEKTLAIHARSLTQKDRFAIHAAGEAISNATFLTTVISSSVACLLAFRGRGNLIRGMLPTSRQVVHRRNVDREMGKGKEWTAKRKTVFSGIMGWSVVGVFVGWQMGGTIGRTRAQSILEKESDNYYRCSQAISETIWLLKEEEERKRHFPGQDITLADTKPTPEIGVGDPRVKGMQKDKAFARRRDMVQEWEKENLKDKEKEET
ncbi:hypothetical protein BT69DRAFT_1286436 [Atractiella rhizophila]|nr:hypothetical protein BT69DRAFT_1286436 [Atractiella rhizophila]